MLSKAAINTSTSGCPIKTPPSLYHRRTASNASHRCYKNYSFALIRKLFFARANQSHQELIWPIFYCPTCAITPFLTKLKLPSKSNLVAPISPPTPGTGRRHEGVWQRHPHNKVWYVPSLRTDGILSTRPIGCTLTLHAVHCSWSAGGGATPTRSCVSPPLSGLKWYRTRSVSFPLFFNLFK